MTAPAPPAVHHVKATRCKPRVLTPEDDPEEVNETRVENRFLRDLDQDWRRWRGVLFLDPFATEVEWSTVEKVAAYHALDTWILFPVSAIARMLPISRQPDDIAGGWADRLTTVFGDERWRTLYRTSPQQTLFGDVEQERERGVDGLLGIYREKLGELFGNRFLKQSRTLRNSRNAALFEFLFCVGSSSRRAITAAKQIAGHIMEHW